VHRITKLMIVIMGVAAVAACSESVQTFSSKKIGMSPDIPLEKVTVAMLRAAQKTQWHATVIQPGLIEAKREWGGGKHNIVVDIVYTSKTYDIKYKSSKNLNYTGTSVHRAYNAQVGNLNKAIKDETWNM
jgi:hypothetical protein